MQHFDIAVIGSGSGNSIINERFSHLDVALIEDNPVFGGTCLNRGCIPTKMFVVAAESAMAPRQAARLGVDLAFFLTKSLLYRVKSLIHAVAKLAVFIKAVCHLAHRFRDFNFSYPLAKPAFKFLLFYVIFIR